MICPSVLLAEAPGQGSCTQHKQDFTKAECGLSSLEGLAQPAALAEQGVGRLVPEGSPWFPHPPN